MATLDEFESRLQSLLEVHLLKHLPGYRAEDGIAQQLAAALKGNVRTEAGVTQAPNLFVIMAHPLTLARWHAKPRLLKELANALYTAGTQAGFHFSLKPTVTTTADENLAENEMRVIASFSQESVVETQGISQGTWSDSSSGKNPLNAFLIFGGNQIIPLEQSVTNIGRRLDNHIVINDPRVSRNHAQLRHVRDRYVIFDLNSNGGTFVNGHRTNQSVLNPGDVITLAGVNLIFGQDSPAELGIQDGQTKPGVSTSSATSTAVSRKENDSIQ